MDESSTGRPGLRVLYILLGILGLLLVFQMICPMAFVRDGKMYHRTVCAANLSGIGKGLHTYANDGNQGMPIALHLLATEPGNGQVRYAPGMIGRHRELRPGATEPTDATTTDLSVTRNLWMLVRQGGSTPASFICPDSDDEKNDEDNPQDYWDFRSYREVSYGYQVPYGKLGRPTGEGDQRMVLAADKGPYGAALELGKPSPGMPNLSVSAPPGQWAPWNSPNHRGEGQNVLYADSHAEWSNQPTAGPKFDNIYTRWRDAVGGTDADPSPRAHGTPPTGTETPFADTDVLIYP